MTRSDRPWRTVVGNADGSNADGSKLHPDAWVSGRGGLLGGETSRRARWWHLLLDCGHRVERSVRYRSLGPRASRGGTQHRSGRDVLPPPRKLRCTICPRTET